jgi:serine/threonine-protein kinase
MIGRLFMGRYQVIRPLGEGGMGRAYLARQHNPDRFVVVKVMHEHVAAEPRFRERFRREMELMQRFNHPNAVAYYDAAADDPLGACLVMEYIRGVGLDVLLAKNKRFTPARVGRLLAPFGDALQAAHDADIVHRDLKPANLMVVNWDTPQEIIKVMDFGLAKLVDAPQPGEKRLTDTNVEFAVGTPGYICPEQVRGEEVDQRGDLYSVGVILYELLSGRLPFDRATSMDLLLAHATEEPPRFADLGLNNWVPPSIEAVVRRCLAKNPDDRPQSARELVESYDAALREAQLLVEAPPMPMPDPPPDPAKPPPDPDALVYGMDAYLPEDIALVKIRGFVFDAGGQVIESRPGYVRVRMGGRSSLSGAFSWIRRSGRRDGPIDMELLLEPQENQRQNVLRVVVRFPAPDRAALNDEQWQHRCHQVYRDARAYLMGQT